MEDVLHVCMRRQDSQANLEINRRKWEMNNKKTIEGKAKTKNGVKRMLFVVLTIFLEVLLIFF